MKQCFRKVVEMPKNKIKIERLKQFVLEELPTNSALRDILLAEKEELSKEEFLAKMDIWLNLIRKEIQ